MNFSVLKFWYCTRYRSSSTVTVPNPHLVKSVIIYTRRYGLIPFLVPSIKEAHESINTCMKK